MLAKDMERLVEKVTYKRGWTVYAFASDSAFLGDPYSLTLVLEAVVENSSRARYGQPVRAGDVKLVNTRNLETEEDALNEILNFIIEQEVHEAREFFKVGADYRAPFHPHTEEGKKNYESRKHNFEIH